MDTISKNGQNVKNAEETSQEITEKTVSTTKSGDKLDAKEALGKQKIRKSVKIIKKETINKKSLEDKKKSGEKQQGKVNVSVMATLEIKAPSDSKFSGEDISRKIMESFRKSQEKKPKEKPTDKEIKMGFHRPLHEGEKGEEVLKKSEHKPEEYLREGLQKSLNKSEITEQESKEVKGTEAFKTASKATQESTKSTFKTERIPLKDVYSSQLSVIFSKPSKQTLEAKSGLKRVTIQSDKLFLRHRVLDDEVTGDLMLSVDLVIVTLERQFDHPSTLFCLN